jgi:hypothetical protein
MKLSDVLAAAMALTPEDRLKLVDAIAVVDDWRIDIVDKPETVADAIAEAKLKSLEPTNNRKAYSVDDLSPLYDISFRMDTDSSFGSEQQRQAIKQAAKQLGRTEKAIAEKIRTISAE